jgi:hypothetical protein
LVVTRQRPTFPRPRGSSIIGLGGLNFRVRYGNGCGPSGKATGNSVEQVSAIRSQRSASARSMSEPEGCQLMADGYLRPGLSGAKDVKPHDRLVLVSYSPYRPSTPSLSTSWSTRGLQGAYGPGRAYLEARFSLRCFQRLSLPNIATRRCRWRDNRHTSGPSFTVLSY